MRQSSFCLSLLFRAYAGSDFTSMKSQVDNHMEHQTQDEIEAASM